MITQAARIGTGTEEFELDAVVGLAADLVRLRTVNGPHSRVVEDPAVALVGGVMRGFGWDVTVTEVAPGRSSVVGVLTGSRGPAGGARPGRTLMFEGHVDVVTEGDP